MMLRSESHVLWRAVDKRGAELDILLQKWRPPQPTIFKRTLRSNPAPRKIVTDQLRYPVAKADVPELANAKHVFVKAAIRADNRAENSHQ